MKKNKLLLPVLACSLALLLCVACGTTADADSTGDGNDNSISTDDGKADADSGISDSGNGSNSATGAKPPMPIPPIAPPDSYKLPAYEKLAGDYNIPVINIYTKNREEVLSLEEYVECVVDVFNCADEFKMDEVAAGIRVRGNSSAHYGDINSIRKYKAPYRIKFEEKQNMLGLNDGAECKSWVLLKTDWNLIANDVAFRMAHAIFEDTIYCSDSTYVHLYINEELQGIYLLCEQNQVNEHRVDVKEPEKGETGTDVGYYFELDNYAYGEGDPLFFMDYEKATVTDIEGVTRAFFPAEYSIKSEITSEAQIKFIENYLNNVFRALYEACENDLFLTVNEKGNLVRTNLSSSYEVANSVLDLESVVNMYILYEIVHDNDCGEGSFFMCVDFSPDSKIPKLQFTSPWDFNWAYTDEPTGQYYAAAFNKEEFVATMGDRSNPWFILLMTEDWFQEMVREKWTALRLSGELEKCLLYEEQYINTHEKEINIKEDYIVGGARDTLAWIRARMEWLDSQWLYMPLPDETLQDETSSIEPATEQ